MKLFASVQICSQMHPFKKLDITYFSTTKQTWIISKHSLTALFNKSLQDAVLPLDWVSVNVCPLYKKGDKQCTANYRPISLTCLLTKVQYLRKLFISDYTVYLSRTRSYVTTNLDFVRVDLPPLYC